MRATTADETPHINNNKDVRATTADETLHINNKDMRATTADETPHINNNKDVRATTADETPHINNNKDVRATTADETPHINNNDVRATTADETPHMLAEKRNENLSKVKNWMRTRLNFNLLRSCLLCLRGSRSIRKETILDVDEIDISLVVEESRLIHGID